MESGRMVQAVPIEGTPGISFSRYNNSVGEHLSQDCRVQIARIFLLALFK